MFGQYKTDIKGEARNPAKYKKLNRGNHTHILSRVYQEINIMQFQKILRMINYDLRHRGCKHYQVINQRGEDTVFEARFASGDLELQVSDRQNVFGKGSSGCIMYCLSKCQIEISGDMISIFPKESGKDKFAHWLSFYNHDDGYKKSEMYMESLPRDYEARMKCNECGAILNKTYAVPGIYFLNSMWGLSSPFNAPRCPKCDNKSYSDINFGFKNIIYRIKTNRPVEVGTLKNKYEKEYREYRKILRDEKK